MTVLRFTQASRPDVISSLNLASLAPTLTGRQLPPQLSEGYSIEYPPRLTVSRIVQVESVSIWYPVPSHVPFSHGARRACGWAAGAAQRSSTKSAASLSVPVFFRCVVDAIVDLLD